MPSSVPSAQAPFGGASCSLLTHIPGRRAELEKSGVRVAGAGGMGRHAYLALTCLGALLAAAVGVLELAR